MLTTRLWMGAILVALTVVASLDRDVVTAARELWPDPWFRATLADAYIGFFTIWLWIAWRPGSTRSTPCSMGWR